MNKDRLRHILKTITYRFFAICVTMGVGYIFTKDWSVGAGITVVDQVLKTAIYYGNERMWFKYIRFKK